MKSKLFCLSFKTAAEEDTDTKSVPALKPKGPLKSEKVLFDLSIP